MNCCLAAGFTICDIGSWQQFVGMPFTATLLQPDESQKLIRHSKIVYQGTRKGHPYESLIKR